VTPRILAQRARVEDGRIAFPGGSKYRVLVMPDSPTMTPQTLRVIRQLVSDGATVIGNPPLKSPSLIDYPFCDDTVRTLVREIWGDTAIPHGVALKTIGKGQVFLGDALTPVTGIFPSYRIAAEVLAQLGLVEDFASPSGKLRYIHRETETADIYFVANRTEQQVVTEGVFRIVSRQPELWDAVSGMTRTLNSLDSVPGVTRVPLTFAPWQSFFMVFAKQAIDRDSIATGSENFPVLQPITRLHGPWEVEFDPKRGGPSKMVIERLEDWTKNEQDGIRYYSGIATYRKTFDSSLVQNQGNLAKENRNARFILDVGEVHDLCRVRLNGHDLGVLWTAPWQVDITSAITDSENELEIEVVNAWANRLIGDQQPGNKRVRQVSWPAGLLGGQEFSAGRFTFVTHDHYKANSPLHPAGLLGPIQILQQEGQTQ
jgi:hypothetical protein